MWCDTVRVFKLLVLPALVIQISAQFAFGGIWFLLFETRGIISNNHGLVSASFRIGAELSCESVDAWMIVDDEWY